LNKRDKVAVTRTTGACPAVERGDNYKTRDPKTRAETKLEKKKIRERRGSVPKGRVQENAVDRIGEDVQASIVGAQRVQRWKERSTYQSMTCKAHQQADEGW